MTMISGGGGDGKKKKKHVVYSWITNSMFCETSLRKEMRILEHLEYTFQA